MDSSATSPAPVRADQRIDTLDVLRGVAICGILLMNIPLMGMYSENEFPALPARWNADWISWGMQTLVAEGTMRGLFTMLFGAGMLLMLRKAEGATPQVAPIDVWARRCIALMGFGLVQVLVFMWPGEILFNYGVTGLFLLAFRTACPKTLLWIAGGVLLVLSVQEASDTRSRVETMKASVPAAAAKTAGKKLTDEQTAAIEAAEEAWKSFHPTAAAVHKEAVARTHLPSLIAWSWGLWNKWNAGSSDWIKEITESLGFMLIGMALFRTGILTGTASPAIYRRMMIFGYAGGFAIRGFGLWWGSRSGFDLNIPGMVPEVSTARSFLHQPARLLVTLGHVGLIVTLFRSGVLGRAWPARALGRMALTTYSLHSILTSILFYGMGWVTVFGFAQLMAIAGGVWIVTGLFCLWWLKDHEMGPAERLLRAIAYGSFRRRRGEAAAILATAPPL